MASVDYFLKLDSVDGESTDSKHTGEIQLESYSFSETNSSSFSSGGGGGVGKVSMQDFNFVKRVDKASAKLLAACASGEHLKTATVVCRKAGKEQQEFLTIVMSPVLVTSWKHDGPADSETVPTEKVSIAFGKVEFKYKEQKPDGSLGGEVIGGWDVTTNKTV